MILALKTALGEQTSFVLRQHQLKLMLSFWKHPAAETDKT